LANPTSGAAGTLLIRGVPPFAYESEYPGNGLGSTIFAEPLRANPRTISNTIAAQSESIPSSRMLSDFLWGWGQFIDHDISLSVQTNGAAVNGSAPISITDPLDPLGPNPIPFTRSNFVLDPPPRQVRRQINENSSYLDASNVYGSDATRATALRSNDGTGAKLLTSAGNLLPLNTAGLPNQNRSLLPNDQLFLAGDIRANENVMVTSMHTLFVREHNRLVDIIAQQQPQLNSEQQYQLARKIVGAELQIVTYREFLPALLGTGPANPRAQDYVYNSSLPAAVTQSFAEAAYRFGHSTVSPNLKLVDGNGVTVENLPVRDSFFNPDFLKADPNRLDQLFAGAASQVSQEIDNLVVDELRNYLFGPPGAGGLDLAALNIQRGRDHGLPDFNELRFIYGLNHLTSFSQITPDATLAQKLSNLYNSNIDNIDPWVGGLAEPHLPGSSLGPFMHFNVSDQFRRLRDGDRLFYLSNALGLYSDGILNRDIAAIINLDTLRLADILRANTGLENLQDNVFFAEAVKLQGDYNGNGVVDAADYVQWLAAEGESVAAGTGADGDGNGVVNRDDYEYWRARFGNATAGGVGTIVGSVPEASSAALFAIAAVMCAAAPPKAQSTRRRKECHGCLLSERSTNRSAFQRESCMLHLPAGSIFNT
jgi:hypothetical protein